MNKINLLKSLDKIIGIPAVYFLSLFPISTNKSSSHLRKILVIRPGGIGDAVLSSQSQTFLRRERGKGESPRAVSRYDPLHPAIAERAIAVEEDDMLGHQSAHDHQPLGPVPDAIPDPHHIDGRGKLARVQFNAPTADRFTVNDLPNAVQHVEA